MVFQKTENEPKETGTKTTNPKKINSRIFLITVYILKWALPNHYLNDVSFLSFEEFEHIRSDIHISY